MRLKSASQDDPTGTANILVQQAIRISNDLYGNDVMSAHEMAKGYTKPVETGKLPMKLSEDVREALEAQSYSAFES